VNEIGGGDAAAPWLLPRTYRAIKAWLSMLARPPRNTSRALAPVWPLNSALLLWAGGLIAVVTGVAIFADAWAITMGRALPSWMRSSFGEVTDLGLSMLFLVPLGTVLLLLAMVDWRPISSFRRRVAATIVARIGFVFVAIAASTLFTAIVKRTVGRARPFVTGEADPDVFSPFSWSDAYASFPSGHATTAFAAAVAAACLWPRARPWLLVYAVLIAVSRVVLSAHHPSDVIAGAVVGTVGALTVRSWFASRRLVFSIDAKGVAVRRPGPSWRRIKQVARAVISRR
jgi:membrane-associated phospholipid phosphatase